MPRTREQFEEIRLSRRDQIINTALALFAKEGYGHVSISTLAEQAGISKGLMYNYFSSKEELLKEVIDHSMQEVLSYFDPNHDGILTQEEFVLFIDKTFELMEKEREFYTQFFRLVVQPQVMDHFKKSSVVSFFELYFKMFANYFESQGFEDPMLEVLNLSVVIEGMGMMMVFYDEVADFPPGLFEKYKQQIIQKYTNNEKN